MALPSEWADDPKLKEEASKQDHKSITLKKGEPLVSKWATVETPVYNELSSSSNTTKHSNKDQGSPNKRKNKLNDLKSRFDSRNESRHKQEVEIKTDLSTRIKNLKLELNSRDSPLKSEIPNEFKNDIFNEDSEISEREKPTKAAIDFASRLGITVDMPKNPKKSREHQNKQHVRSNREYERQSQRRKKVENVTEWDNGKPGTKIAHSLKSSNNKKNNSTLIKSDSNEDKADQKQNLDWEDFNIDPNANWADFDDDIEF